MIGFELHTDCEEIRWEERGKIDLSRLGLDRCEVGLEESNCIVEVEVLLYIDQLMEDLADLNLDLCLEVLLLILLHLRLRQVRLVRVLEEHFLQPLHLLE